MKKTFFIIALSFILLPSWVFAHPGNTASDGCHYCRTNCDKWGVAWNERHCHGGSSKQSQPSAASYNNSSNNKKDDNTSSIWYVLGGGTGAYGVSKIVEWNRNRKK